MRDFVTEIIRRVGDEVRLVDSTLCTGVGIHNHEQYKHMLGKKEGLQRALDEINLILSESEEAE